MAIYHVNQKHPKASDANPGTEDLPFLTIARAATNLQPGDTLCVHPGVYRECVVIPRSGTAEKRITIESVEPLGAVITGADIVTGWQQDPTNENIWVKEGLAIDLPKATERYGLLEGHCEQVFIDGHLLNQVLFRPLLAPGSFFYDEETKSLYLHPATFTGEFREGSARADVGSLMGGGTQEINRQSPDQAWKFIARPFRPEEHTIEVTMRGELFTAGSVNRRAGINDTIDYLTLRGFHFRYAGVLPQHPMVMLNGTGNLVEGCLMEWSTARGLNIHGANSILRNCVIRNNGQMGMSLYGSHQLMEDVDLLYNNYKHSVFGVGENGGCKNVFATGCIMRRVRAIGNDGPGIWFDIDNYNNLIEQCWCEGNSGPGIMYEISYGAIIRNNVCLNNGYQYGKDVRFNTFHHSNGQVEPLYGQGILIQCSSDCQVYNNTCVGNRRLGIELRHHPYIGLDQNGQRQYQLHNNLVLNNLLVNNAFSQVEVSQTPAVSGREGEINGNKVDYNLYHHSDVLLQYKGNLTTYSRFGKTMLAGNGSLEEWRFYTGYDFHSIQWDPYFLAPHEKDFRLDRQSPAIGRGTPIEGLTNDYRGHPRPANAPPTIGAFEYDPADAMMNSLPLAK